MLRHRGRICLGAAWSGAARRGLSAGSGDSYEVHIWRLWSTPPRHPTADSTGYTSSRCSGNISECWSASKRGGLMAEQKKKGLSRLNKAILFLITSAFFFALMNMFVRLSGDVRRFKRRSSGTSLRCSLRAAAMIKNPLLHNPAEGRKVRPVHARGVRLRRGRAEFLRDRPAEHFGRLAAEQNVAVFRDHLFDIPAEGAR